MGAAPGLQEADSTTPHSSGVTPRLGLLALHPKGTRIRWKGSSRPHEGLSPSSLGLLQIPTHKMPEWELVTEQELNLKPEEWAMRTGRSCLEGLDIKSWDES